MEKGSLLGYQSWFPQQLHHHSPSETIVTLKPSQSFSIQTESHKKRGKKAKQNKTKLFDFPPTSLPQKDAFWFHGVLLVL